MDRAIQKGDELTVVIEKLAQGGRGFAKVDGMALFIDRALPGQKMRVSVTAVKERFAEARVVGLLEESPDYVPPFCSHFGECGGCDWQDLDYKVQLRWKRQLVQESLRKVIGENDEIVEDIEPSPEDRYFRNKMEFRFYTHSKIRTLGLHPRGYAGRVFDVNECHIMGGPIAELLEAARIIYRRSKVAAFDPRSKRGFWRFLVLRSNSQGDLLAHIITTKQRQNYGWIGEMADAMHEACPELSGVVHGIRKAPSQVATSDTVFPVLGEPFLDQELMGLNFRLSANAFFQTNTEAAAKLYGHVQDMAGLTGEETVFDLYSGVGSIALTLASKAKQVLGFEIVDHAVGDARENARANEIANCKFFAGDLATTLTTKTLPEADVIVTDPPRPGMEKPVVEKLLELGPRKIVYVSCNPNTFARDAGLLMKEYRLTRVKPVDLFPHSHHTELVGLFEK